MAYAYGTAYRTSAGRHFRSGYRTARSTGIPYESAPGPVTLTPHGLDKQCQMKRGSRLHLTLVLDSQANGGLCAAACSARRIPCAHRPHRKYLTYVSIAAYMTLGTRGTARPSSCKFIVIHGTDARKRAKKNPTTGCGTTALDADQDRRHLSTSWIV